MTKKEFIYINQGHFSIDRIEQQTKTKNWVVWQIILKGLFSDLPSYKLPGVRRKSQESIIDFSSRVYKMNEKYNRWLKEAGENQK